MRALLGLIAVLLCVRQDQRWKVLCGSLIVVAVWKIPTILVIIVSAFTSHDPWEWVTVIVLPATVLSLCLLYYLGWLDYRLHVELRRGSPMAFASMVQHCTKTLKYSPEEAVEMAERVRNSEMTRWMTKLYGWTNRWL